MTPSAASHDRNAPSLRSQVWPAWGSQFGVALCLLLSVSWLPCRADDSAGTASSTSAAALIRDSAQPKLIPELPVQGEPLLVRMPVRLVETPTTQDVIERDLVLFVGDQEANATSVRLEFASGAASSSPGVEGTVVFALIMPALDTETALLTVRSRQSGRTVAETVFKVVRPPTLTRSPREVWELLSGVWRQWMDSVLTAFTFLVVIGYLITRRGFIADSLADVYWRFRTRPVERLRPLPDVPGADGGTEIPAYIVEAARRGSLALVLGAGVSAEAGLKAGTPLWTAIIDRALRDPVSGSRNRELLASLRSEAQTRNSSEIIDAIVGVMGRANVIAAVQAEFSESQVSPRRMHEALARLHCKYVIDMTWDDVTPSLLRPYVAYTPKAADGVVSAIRSEQPMLLKPLGRVAEDEWLALTTQEARRVLSRSPEFERALASVCSSNNLLFVGMSLPAIAAFMQLLPGYIETSSRRNAALIPTREASPIWQAGVGEGFGITQITYEVRPGNDRSELSVKLEQLARNAKQGVSRVQSRTGTYQALTSVQLENIGVFEKLELVVDPHWTILLGNNGGGKSTVIRAITLALAGTDERAKVCAQKLLRTGARTGSIALRFGDDSEVRTQISRSGDSVRVDATFSPLQAGSLVALGFPVLRGVSSRQMKGARAMEPADPSVEDIAPLLLSMVDTRLDDLKQWLLNTLLKAETDSEARDGRMLELVKRVFERIVPGDQVALSRVDKKTWTILVKTPEGEVELDSLSQGMSSIFNWLGVVARRLYDVYPDSKAPEKEYALVVVDEIDAHLHPKWQRSLLDVFQQEFPNVQLVATTHSPLLAGTVDHRQLRLVRRDDQTGKMEIRSPAVDLQGHRVDDILTSEIFDLATTRSPGAEGLIKEFFSLYEQHGELSAPDSERLKQLGAQLERLHYGAARPAWSLVDSEPRVVSDAVSAIDDMDAASLERLKRKMQPQGQGVTLGEQA